MRKLGLAVAFAIGLVMSFAGLTQAATITQNVGALGGPVTGAGLNALQLDNSGHGKATYNFSLTGGGVSELVASFTSSSASKPTVNSLTAFTLTLYSGTTALLSLNQSQASYDASTGTTSFVLDFANFLAEGSYSLVLNVTQGLKNKFVSGNLSITPVPVPAALPLFGTVLIGLMAFQARRRNRFNS